MPCWRSSRVHSNLLGCRLHHATGNTPTRRAMHHRHPQQLRVRVYILPAAYSFGARHGAGARWHRQSRDAIRCILAKDLQPCWRSSRVHSNLLGCRLHHATGNTPTAEQCITDTPSSCAFVCTFFLLPTVSEHAMVLVHVGIDRAATLSDAFLQKHQ